LGQVAGGPGASPDDIDIAFIIDSAPAAPLPSAAPGEWDRAPIGAGNGNKVRSSSSGERAMTAEPDVRGGRLAPEDCAREFTDIRPPFDRHAAMGSIPTRRWGGW
jgi:hypothetical protein